MIEKNFDFDRLYKRIVRYYLGKRHFTKEKANLIAQKVIQKEIYLRTCKNARCSHLLYDHLRNYESCLVDRCTCKKYEHPQAM
ncbi:MAG: hypothetical protein QXW91_05090 [Candidatus Nitrosotenuis sp.]